MVSIPKASGYCYAHPHPAVATDIAIFTVRDRQLSILLVERGEPPFKGMWALPGGFLREDEDLDACARRELFEETGVEAPPLEHFANWSTPARDPRERVISITYLTLLRCDTVVLRPGTDAARANWRSTANLPPLAFDHDKIIAAAIAALPRHLDNSDILLNLVPERFTLGQLQAAYECVLDERPDKSNFRKWIAASGLIKATGEREGGPHRPAEIYIRNPDRGKISTTDGNLERLVGTRLPRPRRRSTL
jgi:8-oxo-dGTP diphosphatase